MKNKHAVALGSIITKKTSEASRINGKKGGRPKRCRYPGCRFNAVKGSPLTLCSNHKSLDAKPL